MRAAGSAKAAFFILAALAAAGSICRADSGPSTPWGQLERARTVYLVTNEDPVQIEPYRVKLPVKRVEVIPLSMVSLRIAEIKKEPIIFLINRGRKLRCSDEEEKLLPYASAAIGSNAVLTYMTRENKRDLRREGSWDVLISAPSRKWLFTALDQFMGLRSIPNPPLTKEIDSIVVVATGGREIARKWIHPVEQSTDWEFEEAEKLDPSASFEGFDEVYLISRDALPTIPDDLLARLPSGIRERLSAGAPISEVMAEKEQKIEGDRRGWRAAIVAPDEEFLEYQMSRYPRIEAIPESLAQDSLKDLTSFSSIAVVARPADRGRTDLASYLDEFAGRVTSALAGTTNFRCANRQDMKEAIYEALQTGQPVELDPSEAEFLGATVKSHVLLVIDVLDVSTMSVFRANDPILVTTAYGRFSEPEPRRPHEPNLNERRYGIVGPKKYKGYDDPAYRHDLREWRDNLDAWERADRAWQVRRWQYEQRVAEHDMEWIVGCNVTESATVTANIRIYSLEQSPGYAPGTVIFSCAISGSSEKTRLHQEDRVIVRGEGRRPGIIKVPPSDSSIRDSSIVAEAIDRAVGQFVVNLHSTALLPGELVNYKPVVAQDPSAETGSESTDTASAVTDLVTPAKYTKPKTPPVVPVKAAAYEETGSVKCENAPKPGAETDALRKQAVESACRKLLTRILMTEPDSNLDLTDVMEKVKVESSGWDEAAGEYWAKVTLPAWEALLD